VNQLPEVAKNPTRRALHQAAVMAVQQSRVAKAQGDPRRERAWLAFADACTQLHLSDRSK
jgi:hypothetical protein